MQPADWWANKNENKESLATKGISWQTICLS